MVNWNQLQNVLLKEGDRDALGLIQIVQTCWKTDIRTVLPDARFHRVGPMLFASATKVLMNFPASRGAFRAQATTPDSKPVTSVLVVH